MKLKPKHTRLKPSQNPEVARLAGLVGKFIEYWGFKRIQGELWCYLYLSARPLSTRELTDLSGASKGTISRVLAELLEYQVVQLAPAGLNGMEYYRANPNVSEAISRVLRERERKLVHEIQASYSEARREGAFKRRIPLEIDLDRAQILGVWIAMAGAFLEQFLSMAGTSSDPFKHRGGLHLESTPT